MGKPKVTKKRKPFAILIQTQEDLNQFLLLRECIIKSGVRETLYEITCREVIRKFYESFSVIVFLNDWEFDANSGITYELFQPYKYLHGKILSLAKDYDKIVKHLEGEDNFDKVIKYIKKEIGL